MKYISVIAVLLFATTTAPLAEELINKSNSSWTVILFIMIEAVYLAAILYPFYKKYLK